MPKVSLSPSPVRLCRSCLQRFGDLKQKQTLGFRSMYFVDFMVFCDFELSCGASVSKKHEEVVFSLEVVDTTDYFTREWRRKHA